MYLSFGLERGLRLSLFFILIIGFQFFFVYEFSLGILTKSVINIPDHEYYYQNVVSGNIVGAISSVNNLVIVEIYRFFYVFGLDVTVVSFVVNALVLVISYWLLEGLIYFKTGRFIPFFYLIPLLSLFQFSVLINKDSFAVLFYISLMCFVLTGNRRYLLLSFILTPIRVQFFLIFLCVVVFDFLRKRSRTLLFLGIFFVYFFGGLISVFIERSEVLLGHQNYSSEGLANVISWLNENYFIGSVLFNLIKPIQYFWDSILSLTFPNGVISSFVVFGRSALNLFVFFNFFRLLNVVYMPWSFRNDQELLALNTLVASFFLVYIVSPVINYRYFLDFCPVILVAILLHRKRFPLKVKL